MASYSVNRIKHATLTPGTADTITFPLQPASSVEVLNRASSGDLYFSLDPRVPAIVGGDDTVIVRAGEGREVGLTSGDRIKSVQIVSASPVAYSVTLF